MAEATQVLYDVRQPIAAMQKLNRAVKRAAVRTRKSFRNIDRGASGSLKNLGSVAGVISPQIAGVTSQLSSIGAALGPISPAVVGVAGAVVAATAAFVDWGEAGRKAIDNIEAAAATARANIERIDVLSGQETAEATRALKQELRDLAQVGAERRIQDARIKTEQATLQTQILQRKDALARIEQAERESAKTVAAIRDQALAGGGAVGAQLDRQLQDLLTLASTAGRAGDIERQQRLLDSARRLTERADRPDFFTQRILQQERGLATDRGPSIDTRVQQRKKELQDEIKRLERRNKELSITSQRLLANQKADRGRRTQVSEEIKRIEAESDINDAIARQNENLAEGNLVLKTRLGLLEEIEQSFRTGVSILFGEGGVAQERQSGQIAKQEEAARRGLAAGGAGDIEGLKQALTDIDRIQESINAAKALNDFTAAYTVRENKVKALRAAIVDAIKEQANLDKALGDVTTRRAEDVAPSRSQATQIQQQQQESQRSPELNQTTQNFNIDLTAGMFDEAALRQLEPVLRRMFRKETSTIA